MDLDELKELVAGALEASLDNCEIYVKRSGILLAFMNDERWLLQPLDVGEEMEDGGEDSEEIQDEGEE